MKFTINTSVETKDKGLDFWKNKSYHTDDKNTSDAARAAFEVFCLTTVYPIYTTGVHGNSGGKMAGKDVFPSGKGRKCLETSGNRYSGFLWDSVEKRQIWEKQKSTKKPYFMRFFGTSKFIRTCLKIPRLTTVSPLHFST